jgi:hypothetical protein
MSELARRFRIDGVSFAPADPGVTEQFFKKGIRGGEERLMLAVLQDAVECFQEHVLAQDLWKKKLFQEAENWILAKNTDWLFSFENICRPYSSIPIISVKACWSGRKRSSRRILLRPTWKPYDLAQSHPLRSGLPRVRKFSWPNRPLRTKPSLIYGLGFPLPTGITLV